MGPARKWAADGEQALPAASELTFTSTEVAARLFDTGIAPRNLKSEVSMVLDPAPYQRKQLGEENRSNHHFDTRVAGSMPAVQRGWAARDTAPTSDASLSDTESRTAPWSVAIPGSSGLLQI